MSELPTASDGSCVTTEGVGMGPDRSTLITAAVLASMAPSIHNSQPWEWRISDNALHLFCVRDRHLAVTDPDRRDLWISLGACLAHMLVALKALGWEAAVCRFPDPSAPHHVAALQLSPHPTTLHDSTLAAAITRRRSDRRRYSNWPVDLAILDALLAAADDTGVIARVLAPSAELSAVAALAADRHAQDATYGDELSVWTAGRRRDDGIPAVNRAIDGQRNPLTTRCLEPRAMAPSGAVASSVDFRTTGELIVFGTAGDDAMARLRSGEALGAMLIEATALGLASCVITEVLEVSTTRRTVQDRFVRESLFPQAIIRLGWPVPGAPPLPPTPRRPIDDVLT